MKTNHSKEPLVSIQCLVYNHEPYLRQCLNGFIMQQTNFPFVAVVHDDASTDHSADIIREYAEKYPDIIKPIYETENQYSKHDGSLTRIVNEACMGKYVALCEGDDFWTNPHKLQLQYDAMESHPECTICLSKVTFADRNGNSLGTTIPFGSMVKEGIVNVETLTHTEFYFGKWCFHTSSFFIRHDMFPVRDRLQSNELKDFPYGDMPLLLSCLISGPGYFVDQITGYYRTDSGGYNSSLKKNKEKLINNTLRVIKGLQALNKLTYFKYKKDIEMACLRYEYRIEVARGNELAIFDNKFKDYRKLIPSRKKAELRLMMYSPFIYNICKKIKQMIKPSK